MDDLLTIREKENSPGEAMDSSTGIDATLNTVEDAMEIESGYVVVIVIYVYVVVFIRT